MTCIPHPVAATAVARPERTVLLDGTHRLTAAQLAQQVAAGAQALVAQGVRPGDTVAFLAQVGVQSVVALHAIGWLGAVALPLPPSPTRGEWEGMLQAAAPDWFLFATSEAQSLPTPPEKRLAWCFPWPTDAPRAPARDWPLEEVRLRMVTSGTTGSPKVVALRVGQLLFNAMGVSWRLGHLPHDRWLCCLPLHHVGGLMILMRAAWSGAQVQLMARFDAADVAAALDGGTIHLVSLVPAMLERVLAARDHVPFAQSLRAVVLGGAAASPALVAQCHALAVPLALSWGMTETASQVATGWPDEPATPGDCGPPLAFAKVRDMGGILQVDGPVVSGAWVTSDRGHVASNGRVQVHGRRDDVIISGGENIAPEEIEAALCAHPEVREAAVLAVPSERWGQRPVALVAPHPGRSPALDDLRSWCQARLSAFKVPDTFALCDALPRNAMGKVSRRTLGASWRAGGFELRADVGTGTGVLGATGQKMQAAETRPEGFAHSRGPAGFGVDEGVHDAQLSAQGPVYLRDGVVEGDRALAQAADAHVHIEPVPHAGGGTPGGLGVNHGGHPVAPNEALLQTAEHGHEHLLEGRVTVLEESRKKNHASPVDIEEANRDPMVKRHG